MKKISILMLCLLLMGAIRTFAQSNCQALYTWTPSQTPSNTLGVLFSNSSTAATGGASGVYSQSYINFGDGGSFSYIWINSLHNYSSPGTYNTTLITQTIDSSTNTVICTDTAHQQVLINYSSCIANISIANNGGGSYTFTAINPSSAPGVTYSWNFGDGTTGTGSPVTHSYINNGNYYVQLTTTGSGCSTNTGTSVSFGALNCDSLHAGFTPIITGLNVAFVNNSTYTYPMVGLNVIFSTDWNFGDGSTQFNTAYPYHTYAAAGTYNINMINRWVDSLTGQIYCADTIVSQVTVTGGNGNPTGPTSCDSLFAHFTPSISGLSVTFNNTSYAAGGPNPYLTSVASWNFGDGSSQSNTVNAYHTYAAAGTYTVTMYNQWQDSLTGQASCYDTFSYQITLGGGNTGGPVFCDSLQASFTSSVSSPVVYFTNTSTYLGAGISNQSDWYFGDGTSQIGTYGGASHTYAGTGTYNVYMINRWVDSFSGQLYCIDSFASQVTISNINYISGYIHLDSMSAPISFDSIKVWLISYDSSANSLTAIDSTFSSAYYPYYQFDNEPAGNYLVKAAVIGQAAGTTGFVPTYHLSSIYWSSATNIVHGGGITPGKDIIMQTGTVTSGPGFVGGSISMGAGKGTGTGVSGMQVYLRGANNTLIASAITDDDGNFSFSNIPVGTYNVYPEAINYATTPYNTIEVAAGQSHITDIDFEQKDNLIYPKKQGTTGISTITKADGLNIYPNPAKTQLFIENGNNLFNTVHIVNTLGQTIQQNKLENGVNKIGLTGINSGIYYLLISGPNGSRSQKIIKE